MKIYATPPLSQARHSAGGVFPKRASAPLPGGVIFLRAFCIILHHPRYTRIKTISIIIIKIIIIKPSRPVPSRPIPSRTWVQKSETKVACRAQAVRSRLSGRSIEAICGTLSGTAFGALLHKHFCCIGPILGPLCLPKRVPQTAPSGLHFVDSAGDFFVTSS